MQKRIALLGFPDCQLLDLTGPAAVFAGANQALGRALYDLYILSSAGGALRTHSGVTLASRALRHVSPDSVHTALVVGGTEVGLRAAIRDRALARWLERAAHRCKRYGSVCSGTFVLAAHGLINGKRVTTHWQGASRLAAAFPKLTVDADALYIEDGKLWTSAGVSTGIDMALAMVEDDHGRQLADSVAAHLVLYVRRPGFQSQFSEALVAQTSASDPLGPVVMYVRANLRAPIDVARLARSAGMSVRSLHRHCLHVLHTTPAKLVEKLRVEHARTLLTTTSLGTKMIAARCGFGSPARMARAFDRTLGVAPSAYRMMFSPPVASAAA
jgi:transcriptional regulator GlxA family with amidase domain